MSPSLCAPSLHAVINAAYSSPSNNPGTSAFARRVFIRSRKAESSTFDSSRMNAIFSPLHPDRRRTARRSSSKSSAEYLLCTLIWKTLSPFIHATKRESVVYPVRPISDHLAVERGRKTDLSTSAHSDEQQMTLNLTEDSVDS